MKKILIVLSTVLVLSVSCSTASETVSKADAVNRLNGIL